MFNKYKSDIINFFIQFCFSKKFHFITIIIKKQKLTHKSSKLSNIFNNYIFVMSFM